MYEQYYIELYGTLKKNNPTNNQRNGIRWDSALYQKYKTLYSTENETYVGG